MLVGPAVVAKVVTERLLAPDGVLALEIPAGTHGQARGALALPCGGSAPRGLTSNGTQRGGQLARRPRPVWHLPPAARHFGRSAGQLRKMKVHCIA